MEWLYNILPIDEAGNFNIGAYLERVSQGYHNVWMPILIVISVLGLWFVSKFVRRLHRDALRDSDTLLEGNVKMANAILFIVTNLLIICYVFTSGPTTVWFLLPGDEGNWWQVLIYSIIYLYVLVNLLVALIKTIDDFTETDEKSVSLKWGIITLVVGIAVIVICALSAPTYLVYAVSALIVCQVLQMGLIFHRAANQGTLTALAACGIYLTGTIGLVMIAIPFILLVVILTIVAFMFVFILKSSMEEDKKRDVIVYSDGRIVDKYNGTEYEQNADGTIKPKYP